MLFTLILCTKVQDSSVFISEEGRKLAKTPEKDAIYWRGAPWTFDEKKLSENLERIGDFCRLAGMLN
jgi:hypothetical protein